MLTVASHFSSFMKHGFYPHSTVYSACFIFESQCLLICIERENEKERNLQVEKELTIGVCGALLLVPIITTDAPWGQKMLSSIIPQTSFNSAPVPLFLSLMKSEWMVRRFVH